MEPMDLSYVDQSNNRYKLYPNRIEYIAARSKQSSTGSYHGGCDQVHLIDHDQHNRIMDTGRGTLSRCHREQRNMGDGILRIGDQKGLVPYRGESEFKDLLSSFLVTKPPFVDVKVETLGYHLTVREASVDDAEALRELKLSYLESSGTIPLYDFEYPSLEEERNQIIRYSHTLNALILVAEVDGKLVANLDLNPRFRKKLEHTAMLGMGVHPDWQSHGVGKTILRQAMTWAESNPILDIIWLEVYGSNEAGQRLYKGQGFEQTGVMPGFFYSADGRIDNIQMMKRV